jgi:hypothetical protein
MFNVFSPTGLPGFRVRPQDDVPDFDIDENGLPRRERPWSDGMRPGSAAPQYPDLAQAMMPTPGPEDSVQPAPPQPPDWLYKLLTMPLPALPSRFAPLSGGGPAPHGTLFNPVRSYPTTDQNVREMGDARAYVPRITPPPALSAVEGPDAEQWPSLDAPKPPADTDPRDAAMPDAQPAFGGPLPAPDRTADPLGATPPPSFPGWAAPAEGPQLPLASFTYAANPLPTSGQRPPLSSLAGSAPGEGLLLADAGPADAAAPGVQPAFDGPQPASDRTVDPNIVRVAGGEPAVNDEVQIAQQQGTPQPKLGKDPSPGVVVVLPDGSTIPDPGSPTGQVMSPVADLQTVAAKGREAGATFREMRKNPMTRAGASAYMLATLGLNVGQGGTFDHQRSGNMLTGYTQFYHFRPIANVNVGVFAQQAGLTLEETLDIAGLYARNFSRNSDPSKPHGLDPKTLHYITVGYKIGQSGVFDPPRTP